MTMLRGFLSAVAAALCGALHNPIADPKQVLQSNYVDLGTFPGYWGCYGIFSRAAKEHCNPAMAAFYRERRLHRKGRMLNTKVDFRWVLQ